MAKIHTVEWTPAILPHPLTILALRTNWHGLAPGLQKVFTGLTTTSCLAASRARRPTTTPRRTR